MNYYNFNMKTVRSLLAAIRKADQMFNLIEKGDKIAIGISGGKDSLTLLYCLNLYKKFSRTSFEIVPIMLDLGFDNFNPTNLKIYIKSISYDLNVVDAKEVYKILKKQQKDKNHLPCSICSRMKKASINKKASELGCNKVAFAHHADDAIETLFMNEIYGARLATFSPKMKLERANITFIRPLCLVREKQIIRFAKEENLPILKSSCPADKHTTREDIKNMLKNLYEKFESSYENFLSMLYNYSKLDLWDNNLAYQIDTSGLILKPVTTINDKNNELNIRYKVFIMELKMPFKEEADTILNENIHSFLIMKKSKLVGTIRYIEETNRTIKIERLAILKSYRNKGYGKKALLFLLKMIKEKYTPVTIYLHSLNSMSAFYEKLGFKKEDKPFIEAKKRHIKMAINL